MFTQLAGKIQPYFNYIVWGQAILLTISATYGILIILRRIRGRSNPGSLAMDADAVAQEISQEIHRLQHLRTRLSSKFHEHTGGAPTGDPVVSAAPAASSEDTKAVEAQIEARYLDTITELKSQILKLEDERSLLIKDAGNPSGPNDAIPIETQAALTDANARVEKLERDASEAQGKVLHLEKVLAEYRLFEEDFALVKRYKAENEKLKKQVPTTGQVTEDDINQLFGSIETPPAEAAAAPATAAAPEAPISSENFLSSEFAAAAEPAVTVKAAPAEAAAPTTTLTSTNDGLPPASAAVISQSAPATPSEPAVVIPGTPNPLKGATAAKIGAQPATAPTSPATPPAPVEQKSGDDRLSRALEAGEDMESLAEAAGSDDKLLEEFQKILGDKP